jgi:hypothetical protein
MSTPSARQPFTSPSGKHSSKFKKPTLGMPDSVYYWGDFLGTRGNRQIYTYFGFLDDDGKAKEKLDVPDTEKDALATSWEGNQLYGSATPIPGFKCPLPPTERNLDKEPVLIFDHAHPGNPDSLSAEEKENQRGCPVPWKFTDHPWKADVTRWDVFSGGGAPLVRPAKRKCGHHKFAFSSLESASYYPQVIEQPFSTGMLGDIQANFVKELM